MKTYLLLSPPHREDVLGSGGIAVRVLNLGARLSFTLRPLYRRYPLDRMLGVTQSQFGHGGEEREIPSLTLPRTEPWPSSQYLSLCNDLAFLSHE